MTKYYYDSYAIVEFLNENDAYRPFFREGEGVTSFYNLLEVYYAILREGGNERAKTTHQKLLRILADVKLEDAEPAMLFRYKYKKRKLSYADCLGYTMAKRLGLLFVTGDAAFKDIPGVKYVK